MSMTDLAPWIGKNVAVYVKFFGIWLEDLLFITDEFWLKQDIERANDARELIRCVWTHAAAKRERGEEGYEP